jgi:hypothetical protein
LKYPETVVPPTTEDVAGSDYDKDAESIQEPEANEMPEELMAEQAEAAEERQVRRDGPGGL